MSIDYQAMAQGRKGIQGKIEAESIRPIRNRVLVHNMHFCESLDLYVVLGAVLILVANYLNLSPQAYRKVFSN